MCECSWHQSSEQNKQRCLHWLIRVTPEPFVNAYRCEYNSKVPRTTTSRQKLVQQTTIANKGLDDESLAKFTKYFGDGP